MECDLIITLFGRQPSVTQSWLNILNTRMQFACQRGVLIEVGATD